MLLRPIKNGIYLPKDRSIAGKVWDIADKISIAQKRPAKRPEVMEAVKKNKKLNLGTARNFFTDWETFHDVKGYHAKQEKIKKKAKVKPKPKKKKGRFETSVD